MTTPRHGIGLKIFKTSKVGYDPYLIMTFDFHLLVYEEILSRALLYKSP